MDACRYGRFGGSRIEHLRDVRVVHHRQRLSLGFEPGDDLPRVHAQLDDLERDAAANWFFLLGHIDHAAAPFADLLEKFVMADVVAGFFGKRSARRQVAALTGRQDACRHFFGGSFFGGQAELEQAREAMAARRVSAQFRATARAFS